MDLRPELVADDMIERCRWRSQIGHRAADEHRDAGRVDVCVRPQLVVEGVGYQQISPVRLEGLHGRGQHEGPVAAGDALLEAVVPAYDDEALAARREAFGPSELGLQHGKERKASARAPKEASSRKA